MEQVRRLESATHHRVTSDISQLINFCYEVVQSIIVWLFQPRTASVHKPGSKGLNIAVIGAGLSGVSAAAHCVGHGTNVTLFEAGSRDNLGGIWSRVNSTSSLQVYSILYRFHPTVQWHRRYPGKARIVEEITKLWQRFGLEKETRFDTPVTSVNQKGGKWIINNDPSFGRFDGVIPCIGTCGEPKMPHLPNQEAFQGQICHSSQMDDQDVQGKRIIIVGGGASAIEVVENVVARSAKQINIVSRVSTIFRKFKFAN